jgi:hypothetical protein
MDYVVHETETDNDSYRGNYYYHSDHNCHCQLHKESIKGWQVITRFLTMTRQASTIANTRTHIYTHTLLSEFLFITNLNELSENVGEEKSFEHLR